MISRFTTGYYPLLKLPTSNDLNQIYVGTATACSALTFNAPTITGATYTWKDPNNNTQTGQSVSFPGAVAGNYTLTVTGGPGGCSSTVTLTPVIYGSSIAAFNTSGKHPCKHQYNNFIIQRGWKFNIHLEFWQRSFTGYRNRAGAFHCTMEHYRCKNHHVNSNNIRRMHYYHYTKHYGNQYTFGNYTYSRTITMKNAAVGMSANVTNFPVFAEHTEAMT